ncbi:MAG: F0F1 ATP synthase subunit B [Synechococcus sp.]
MAIDWFTFGAQIVNFIILVLLLKRFLYGPITQAMQERQRQLEARWREAEEQKADAQQQADLYRQQQQNFEHQQDALMTQAKTTAEVLRQDLVRQARLDTERLQDDWQAAVERERDEFLDTLRHRIAREAWEISRQALQELANVEIEQRVVEVFIDRLSSLEAVERSKLVDSMQDLDKPLAIRTSFELSPDIRQLLIDALQAQHMLGARGAQFSTSSEIIAGIELQAGERAISWNFESYLETLDERFSVALASR